MAIFKTIASFPTGFSYRVLFKPLTVPGLQDMKERQLPWDLLQRNLNVIRLSLHQEKDKLRDVMLHQILGISRTAKFSFALQKWCQSKSFMCEHMGPFSLKQPITFKKKNLFREDFRSKQHKSHTCTENLIKYQTKIIATDASQIPNPLQTINNLYPLPPENEFLAMAC